ncbi:MAG: hypothetical protein MUC89_17190 [Acetobacteraceae bacterium]|jgi:hypothetical protein|nr:hypothetical protein [Acetobacteraceae bacterium]
MRSARSRALELLRDGSRHARELDAAAKAEAEASAQRTARLEALVRGFEAQAAVREIGRAVTEAASGTRDVSAMRPA